MPRLSIEETLKKKIQARVLIESGKCKTKKDKRCNALLLCGRCETKGYERNNQGPRIDSTTTHPKQ